MTVFKTYFKILKNNKFIIIMYTAILLLFSIIGTTSGSTTNAFSASKPNIAIINYDYNSNVVENLTNYIKDNANIVNIKNEESSLADALFYKDLNAIIYIYDGYTNDYINNFEKNLTTRFTSDYSASYMKMLLERYFKIADIANNNIKDEQEIINTINSSLKKEVKTEIKNTIDTNRLSTASYYYNFANYSILAICIYLIAVVMSTFNQENIKKRNLVSSKRIVSLTKELYFGNAIFVFTVWLFVVLISLILLKDVMFSVNGLWMIFNSFIFMFTALGLGFLTGTILKSKDAINGITNVVALGSSFMCGCFVPIEFMPAFVVQISKIWPTYWYISNNNLIADIEIFNFNSVLPLIFNMVVMIIFAVVLFALAVMYNKKHTKD